MFLGLAGPLNEGGVGRILLSGQSIRPKQVWGQLMVQRVRCSCSSSHPASHFPNIPHWEQRGSAAGAFNTKSNVRPIS